MSDEITDRRDVNRMLGRFYVTIGAHKIKKRGRKAFISTLVNLGYITARYSPLRTGVTPVEIFRITPRGAAFLKEGK